MEEKTFFEYEDVKVTNSRFISGGQTYAMNNVTSVKTQIQKPSRWIGILLLLLGALLAINASAAMGLILVFGSGIFLYLQKTTYHVMLSTSGGETSALKTYQIEYVTQVVNALNEAIVYRG